MDLCAASELNATRQHPTVGESGDGILNSVADAIDGLADVCSVLHIDGHKGPTHNITVQGHKVHDFAAFDRDKGGALGAGLAYVASLQVPRKYDMGSLVEHLSLMHVAKCPIVVALVHQVIKRAWRIVLMATHATKSRVQDANVERTVDRVRISQCQIIGDIAFPETLPMENNIQIIYFEGLRFS